MCKNCGQSDNVNCLCGHHGVVVIMKKCSDHEIYRYITKIFIEPRKFGAMQYAPIQ